MSLFSRVGYDFSLKLKRKRGDVIKAAVGMPEAFARILFFLSQTTMAGLSRWLLQVLPLKR